MQKYVYYFGDGHAEGNAKMKDVLGGKGAGLAEMTNIGVPVPPGFTITTEVCTAYYANAKSYPTELKDQVARALAEVETLTGAKFGDLSSPLLVSVRSGGRASMPGKMDTILNLGLNDETVEGLARQANDARFAYDSYRRFIQMYSDVVLGVDHYSFEHILEIAKEDKGVTLDTEPREQSDAVVRRLAERVPRAPADRNNRAAHRFPSIPRRTSHGVRTPLYGPRAALPTA